MPELFQANPNIKRWKIDFTVLTNTFYDGTGFGTSSIVIGVNELPTGGYCEINPQSGITGNTTFFINCPNWFDPDGFITKLKYYGNSK